MNWIDIPDCGRYWLARAHVPMVLLCVGTGLSSSELTTTDESLALVDVQISDGRIAAIQPHSPSLLRPRERRAFDGGRDSDDADNLDDSVVVDLRGGQVWPCFVDLHTHLDKGHIWPRTPNTDGTFLTALERARADRDRYWIAEDLYRRMTFGLQCSYVHGTAVVRTHLDSFGEQAETSWQVFKQLRLEWQDKIELQAASIHPLDLYLTPEGERLADLVAESGGLLGGVPMMGPTLEAACDRLFELAAERDLDVDLHVDESGDPNDVTLQSVARAAIAWRYEGRVVCGHCCSLAVQPPERVGDTLALVADAGIGVVSLPQCNLYLQDRQGSASLSHLFSSQPLPSDRRQTPRWRGVTLLHELKQSGVPVAVASDNCRDPFHSFGDHDMLDVFGWAARIAHFDMPYGDWPSAVSCTPATLARSAHNGTIQVGLPANLAIFRGRTYSELLARHQGDRVILRDGRVVTAQLPPYEDLDDLMD